MYSSYFFCHTVTTYKIAYALTITHDPNNVMSEPTMTGDNDVKRVGTFQWF